MLHPVQMGEAVNDAGQHRDNEKGGEHDAQRGHDAAHDAPLLLSHEGGGIDGDDARGTLADSEIVHQLLIGGPAFVLYHLPLEDGQHGHAAAECHDAHLGEGEEQFP